MKLVTLKRVAAYLLTFFVTLSLIIGFTNFSHDLDTYLVERVNSASNSKKTLTENISVVHLEKEKQNGYTETLKKYRQRIVKFLNSIAYEFDQGNKVKGIVLDNSFSNDPVEIPNLKEALKNLKEKGIKVYAAYNINEDISFDKNEEAHAAEIYNGYLEGSGEQNNFGSARFHTRIYLSNGGLVTYEPDMILVSDFGDSVKIESLARRVAIDLSDSKIMLKNLPQREGLVIPLGSKEEIELKTYTFVSDTISEKGTFEPYIGGDNTLELEDKILVVGDIRNDFIGGIKTPGPFIVTWAINDLLNLNMGAKQPLEGYFIIIGQALFFALFTVLIFALIFKYVKRLQTKTKTLAFLSFLISSIVLFIYGALLLIFNAVIPIGITLVAMAIAAVLLWRFAHKFMVTCVADGGEVYDVFISYSHGNSEWVEENVYKPLKAIQKADGSKLKIFFDKDSIGVGEAFTAKYMWAIVDSKLFIPIMSEEYYGKNHCRNEMDIAYKRYVENKLKIKPIAFSFKCVPEIFTDLNILDITVESKFIEKIQNELILMESKG